MGTMGAIFIACLDYGAEPPPSGVAGPYRVVAASIIAPGQQAGTAFTPGPVARLVTSPGSAAGQIGGQT